MRRLICGFVVLIWQNSISHDLAYIAWVCGVSLVIRECVRFLLPLLSLHLTFGPPHDKINKMTLRAVKTQISLGIRPVLSESSLCAQCAKDPSFLQSDSEDWSDWADLSLHWAYMPFCWFCHETANFCWSFLSHLSRSITNQQNIRVPSEDTDQPGQPPSLIIIIVFRLKKPWVLSYPVSAQRRLIRLGGCTGWSESSMDTQVILSVLCSAGSFDIVGWMWIWLF